MVHPWTGQNLSIRCSTQTTTTAATTTTTTPPARPGTHTSRGCNASAGTRISLTGVGFPRKQNREERITKSKFKFKYSIRIEN